MQSNSFQKLLYKRQNHSRLFVILLLPLIFFSDDWLGDRYFIKFAIETLGIGLVIICVLGRSYCAIFIGGVKNKMVIQEGPFSIVRNPLYVFSFLGILGIGLQSGRLSIAMLLIGAFILYYKQVVASEETYLLGTFGDAYQEYNQRVPRWWPKWKLWQEPAEILMRPFFLRQTMIDATAFFIAGPTFKLLDILHDQAALPYYITLP